MKVREPSRQATRFVVFAVFIALDGAFFTASAQQSDDRWNCPGQCPPAALQCKPETAPRSQRSDDEQITADYGLAEFDADGGLDLTDGVEFRQGDRTLRTQEMHRDAQGQ